MIEYSNIENQYSKIDKELDNFINKFENSDDKIQLITETHMNFNLIAIDICKELKSRINDENIFHLKIFIPLLDFFIGAKLIINKDNQDNQDIIQKMSSTVKSLKQQECSTNFPTLRLSLLVLINSCDIFLSEKANLSLLKINSTILNIINGEIKSPICINYFLNLIIVNCTFDSRSLSNDYIFKIKAIDSNVFSPRIDFFISFLRIIENICIFEKNYIYNSSYKFLHNDNTKVIYHLMYIHDQIKKHLNISEDLKYDNIIDNIINFLQNIKEDIENNRSLSDLHILVMKYLMGHVFFDQIINTVCDYHSILFIILEFQKLDNPSIANFQLLETHISNLCNFVNDNDLFFANKRLFFVNGFLAIKDFSKKLDKDCNEYSEKINIINNIQNKILGIIFDKNFSTKSSKKNHGTDKLNMKFVKIFVFYSIFKDKVSVLLNKMVKNSYNIIKQIPSYFYKTVNFTINIFKDLCIDLKSFLIKKFDRLSDKNSHEIS
ncbi:hypothetical protein [Lyticum sinuosum]|uniref:Uncharacterized protein n=1 Tax=Lyticum sinuosum TaxID=1332059 RepID=A0AAE4VKF7_9RICK|nr:hypothetical protein [Lyticum sinuosum]MDZ5761165.1 hypothetical protein [Lyticum sinuosum]